MHRFLWFVVAYASSSTALLYNPSFNGGTGCAIGGVIDNSNCTSSSSTIQPRQATNGAGVLCYDGAKNCNVDCPTKDCYPDMATCATGYAGGYIKNLWICPSDNALFTASTTPKGLPNGAGVYCFLNDADCATATNSAVNQCKLDTTSCSTGQAGPTPHNFIHINNSYSYANGVPNGAGVLCFDNQAHCESSNNNPCSSLTTRCTADTMTCATGAAGPLPVTFTCSGTYPPGSFPNGGGQLCYDTPANCVGGPNACNDVNACVLDFATCSTGVAGPTPSNYFCPQDMTTSLPNGGGQLCYGSAADCVNGPNYCADSSTCVTNTATCGTGQVGPTVKNTFCQYDQPHTLVATPGTPGSLPNAAGGNCYFSKADCLNGPNACTNAATECLQDFTTCSTGQAGPTDAWFFCQKDAPYGGLADGGGQLCYGAAGNCLSGPNACGWNTPCELDFTTCSTGPAGPTINNWFCVPDNPIGISTMNRALPSGSGMLCWDSVDDCIGGPNACTAKGADCLNNNLTLKVCSTGMAGGNSLGNNVACMKDFPSGAVANAAGKWCYDTMSNCVNGTNACNSSAPCVNTPATVCATAGSSNSYYCAYDYPYPKNVSSGLSSVGNLCYKTALDCMNGPNACNTSFLCQSDTNLLGACKGASYPFFCSLNSVGGIGTPIVAGTAPPSPAPSVAATLASAALLALFFP